AGVAASEFCRIARAVGRYRVGLSRSRPERLRRHLERRDAGFGGFLLQWRDLVGAVGNAAPAAFVFVTPLRLAGHENLVEAWRGGSGVHALDQRVHAV